VFGWNVRFDIEKEPFGKTGDARIAGAIARASIRADESAGQSG
jgi:hypothetical protein